MKKSIIKYTLLFLILLLHHLSTTAQQDNPINAVLHIYVNSQDYKKMQERIQELQEFCADSENEEKFKYCNQLDVAQKELKAFKQEVVSLAKTFHKVAINTEHLQKAKALFEAGEFDKARRILNTEVLESDQQQLLQRKAVLEKDVQENNTALKNNADEFLIKAKLTAINYEHPNRFEATTALFEASLKSDRNAENMFAYANFLKKYHQIDQAMPLYLEVVALRKSLTKKHPKIYLPHIAHTLNDLGKLKKDKNEYEEAETFYLKALKIYQHLAKDHPKTYLPYVAKTKINLSVFYQESKINKEHSIQLVDEAITNLLPIRYSPYVQDHLEVAYEVLEAWDIDSEAYVAQKLKQLNN